jgi:hypothetical protein
MSTIIQWIIIIFLSLLCIFFLVSGVGRFFKKDWKDGTLQLCFSGIAVSFESNLLKETFHLSQQVVNILMWILAISVFVLFILAAYDYATGNHMPDDS